MVELLLLLLLPMCTSATMECRNKLLRYIARLAARGDNNTLLPSTHVSDPDDNDFDIGKLLRLDPDKSVSTVVFDDDQILPR